MMNAQVKTMVVDDVTESTDSVTEEMKTERVAGGIGSFDDDTDDQEYGGFKSPRESVVRIDPDVMQAETLSVSAKCRIRQQLEDEIAKFLAQGGQIEEVPSDDAQPRQTS